MDAFRTIFCLSIVFFDITPAHAYLDPGPASIAIQAILAGIAGGLATIKLWGGKIRAIFQRKRHEEKEDEINGK